MLNRIVRYGALVATSALLALWIWSYFFCSEIVYHSDPGPRWTIGSKAGLGSHHGLVLVYQTYPQLLRPMGCYTFPTMIGRNVERGYGEVGLRFHNQRRPDDWYQSLGNRTGPRPLGFVVYEFPGWERYVVTPIWMPLLPLLALTTYVWYHPIRNRLRGKRDAGFAVEVTDDQVRG